MQILSGLTGISSLVAEQDVQNATSTVTFSNLSAVEDGAYFLVATLKNNTPTSGNVGIYLNADTNNADYTCQTIIQTGSTLSGASEGTPFLGWLVNHIEILATIMLGADGSQTVLTQSYRSDNNQNITSIRRTVTASDITSITISTAVADAIAPGSKVQLYRLNNSLNGQSAGGGALNLLAGKKYACFGDSITSDQVTGIGTSVNAKLGTSMIQNFACGYATCQDWQDSTSGANITTVTLTAPNNTETNDNVLSNQVRRLLQWTTASGAQITWTHPIDGAFSLPTSVGTGLGHTNDIPDVIYIAISTNDGENTNTPIVDDTSTVFGQTYTNLTLTSIASALRWAIETLQSAYPNAQIFVASPLQTDSGNTWMSFANGQLKRNIIQEVCQFCSVYFIDSFNESGFSALIAKNNSNGGIHPTTTWKGYVTNYVASRITEEFVSR